MGGVWISGIGFICMWRWKLFPQLMGFEFDIPNKKHGIASLSVTL
jgi:hypothetical protein